jgi:hypothetical protein
MGSLLVGSITACHRDPGIVAANDDVVGRASSADKQGGKDDNDKGFSNKVKGEASPYVVGVWKFKPNPDPNKINEPLADTEFRFINPTALDDVTLEYAFFELDGSPCGCDRDSFPHNHTTVYTMLGELMTTSPPPLNLPVFTCTGTSGALKSIAFRNKGQKIFLDDALQVGFQTHAFGDVEESPLPDPNQGIFPNFLTGKRMTEAGLKGIPINNDDVREDIEKIHEECVSVNGPLM